MQDNPYQSPATAEHGIAIPRYTRFRLLLDIFCLAAALIPVGLRIVVETTGLPTVPVFVARAVLLTLAACWITSIVLNFAGTPRLRVVSIIGVILNVVSVAAML